MVPANGARKQGSKVADGKQHISPQVDCLLTISWSLDC
jgi:hypothetical protein